MNKLLTLIIFSLFLWGCGNSSITQLDGDGNVDKNTSENMPISAPAQLANEFCTNQKNLQILSTSLLSAYSAKGNASDMNYCGGSAVLNEDGLDFTIDITDYCVNARGQQVTLNGDIVGAVESGANFTSDINELSVAGDGVDLQVTGYTFDGRADDMFVTLDIYNPLRDETVTLERVSIKKGEFDFGTIDFANTEPHQFKFIDHFNDDLTKGQLFIYGEGEELLIISADNGDITVVYKKSKLDPGTLVDSSCGTS